MDDNVDVYRVRKGNPLVRSWQAEWPGCGWCPRAYTELGARRKAGRWRKRSVATTDLRLAWKRWARAHVWRRWDESYAPLRATPAATPTNEATP